MGLKSVTALGRANDLAGVWVIRVDAVCAIGHVRWHSIGSHKVR